MHSSLNHSCFSIHGLAIGDAYTKLDHEISQLQTRLHSLRILRNSLAPISKVPTEILSKIFVHTQEHVGSPFNGKLDISTRFYVSWVCRVWRDTALATQDLWTVISKRSQDVSLEMHFIQALLARNGNRPLTIGLYKPSFGVMDTVSELMSRIETMRLIRPDSTGDFEELWSQPAPLLKCLEVDLSANTEPFSGVHPHLHRLMATNTAMEVISPLITPNLTSLHIILPSGRIRVESVVEMLVTLTSLTELVLAGCLENMAVTLPSKRINLPALQTISIQDWFVDPPFGLLASLDIPQSLVTLTWPNRISDSQATLENISSKLHLSLAQISCKIRHLEIQTFPVHPDISIRLSDTPTRHRYICNFQWQELLNSFTEAFFSALSLEHLETVSVDDLNRDLVPKLACLTNLKSLTLDGDEPLEPLTLKGGFEPNEGRTPFHSLEELTLCNFETWKSEMDDLKKALAMRKEAGSALSKLVAVKSPDIEWKVFEELVGVLSIVDRVYTRSSYYSATRIPRLS